MAHHNATFLLSATVATTLLLLSTSAYGEDAPGLEVGPFQAEAGLRLESGFDSNVYYQSTEADGPSSAVVNITPSFSLDTRDPRMVDMDSTLAVSWEQYLGSGSNQRDQSGIEVDGGIGVRFNPQGVVSVRPSNRLQLLNTPNYSQSTEPIRNLSNLFELELGLHPGGAVRSSRLGLSGALTGYHQAWRYLTNNSFDKNAVGGRLSLKWNFLPKTAVFLDSMIAAVSYENAEALPVSSTTDTTNVPTVANVDSMPMRVSAGFTGLLAPRFSLLVSGGFGAASYDVGEDMSTYLINVEMGLHLSPRDRGRFGYEHNFDDTLIANALEYHRGYLGFNTAAGRLRFDVEGFLQRSTYTVVSPSTWVIDSGDSRVDLAVGVDAELGFAATDWMDVAGTYRPETRTSNVSFGSPTGGFGDANYVKHSVFLTLDFHTPR